MSILGTFRSLQGKSRGLLVVITAALLVELLSAAQYFYTHRLLEGELEKRAESELTLKAILTKGMLNEVEHTLNNHLWVIRRDLSNADSVRQAITRIAQYNRNLKGVGVGFVPNYFPSEGRLVEFYSSWSNEDGGRVVTRQIADDKVHDYTKSLFWREAMAANGEPVWVEPYVDNEGAGGLVTTLATAIRDDSDSIMGFMALDLSLEWLADTIGQQHIYPSSFVLLLTEDGQPIIRPSANRVSQATTASVISQINDSTVARQLSKSGRSRRIKFKADGRDAIVFYANMKGQPHWQLALVCYDDEVYASLSSFRLWFLLLMLVAFCIILCVIWRFARREKKLQQKVMEEERMAGELRLAYNIQQALLPSLGGEKMEEYCSCAGRLIPAREVGGDLYNAFVRDGKLFFCIGDVSGKGVPAAIIMAITQTLFRNIAERESSPVRIMEQLNVAACRNNDTNVFVTLFIGVLDLPTGHLRYCNAGHEVPLLDGEQLNTEPNLPIGLFGDFKYKMQEAEMTAGSTLFLYTDGLTEARRQRPAHVKGQDAKATKIELLGSRRVVEFVREWTLKKSAGLRLLSEELVENVIAEVQRFSGGAEQSDDLTLLAITYTPPLEPILLDETLTLKNDVHEVAALNTFAKDVLARLGIEKPMAMNLRLALEEAVVNVMEYAYPAGAAADVGIRVVCSMPKGQAARRNLLFIITDTGIAFNPTEAAIADTTLSAEERPVGGLGILLVRKLMDSINYERINGKNVLTLKKTINTQT